MVAKILIIYLVISYVGGYDFEGKIHEIIDKIHPLVLLADLKQNIEHVVRESYVTLDPSQMQECQCFTDVEIKNLDKFGGTGFAKCRKKMEGIEKDLVRRMKEIKDIGQDIISRKPIEISKCSYFHFCSDSSNVVVCLQRLATPVDVVLIDINKALEEIRKVQDKTFQIVLECASQLQEDLIDQEIKILKNHRHCLISNALLK